MPDSAPEWLKEGVTRVEDDPVFIALLQQESGGKHRRKDGSLVTSPAGARGITQLMPYTAKDPGFGVKPAADDSEEEYLRVGRDYLNAMRKRYGNEVLALTAYNAGPGRVDRFLKTIGDPRTGTISEDEWVRSLPNEEWRGYAPSILARAGGQGAGGAGGGYDSADAGTMPLAAQASATDQVSGFAKPLPGMSAPIEAAPLEDSLDWLKEGVTRLDEKATASDSLDWLKEGVTRLDDRTVQREITNRRFLASGPQMTSGWSPTLAERAYLHFKQGSRESLLGAGAAALSDVVNGQMRSQMDPETGPTSRQRISREARQSEIADYEEMVPAYGFVENSVALLSHLAGSALSPESLIGPGVKGATTAARALKAGVIGAASNVAVDPVVQGLNIAAKNQEEYDLGQTALAGPVGFVTAGGLQLTSEGLAAAMGALKAVVARDPRKANVSVEDILGEPDFKDIAPDVRRILEASNIDPKSERAADFIAKVSQRVEADKQPRGQFPPEPGQMQKEAEAIALGEMDPAASARAGLEARQTPDVIYAGTPDGSIPGRAVEPGVQIGYELRGTPPSSRALVPMGDQPTRMTPDEIARARAEIENAARMAAKRVSLGEDTLVTPPDRLPQTRDDVAEQRAAQEAFDVEQRQRERLAERPDTADTQAAGRPEGFAEQPVVLDGEFPVKVIRVEQVNGPNGKPVRQAIVRRYDPRTGAFDADSIEYPVEASKLRQGTYAKMPRQAVDFRQRAKGPRPAEPMPEQTFRATAPDAGETYPGATSGESGSPRRQPFPEQPQGSGGRRWSSAEEIFRDFQENGQRRADERAQSDAGEAPKGKQKYSMDAADVGSDGFYPTDAKGYVMSKEGTPIKFWRRPLSKNKASVAAADKAARKAAARWILDIGQKGAPDQGFDLANHPSGEGFTIVDTGRRTKAAPGADRPKPDAAPETPLALPAPRAAEAAAPEAQARSVPAEVAAPAAPKIEEPAALTAKKGKTGPMVDEDFYAHERAIADAWGAAKKTTTSEEAKAAHDEVLKAVRALNKDINKRNVDPAANKLAGETLQQARGMLREAADHQERILAREAKAKADAEEAALRAEAEARKPTMDTRPYRSRYPDDTIEVGDNKATIYSEGDTAHYYDLNGAKSQKFNSRGEANRAALKAMADLSDGAIVKPRAKEAPASIDEDRAPSKIGKSGAAEKALGQEQHADVLRQIDEAIATVSAKTEAKVADWLQRAEAALRGTPPDLRRGFAYAVLNRGEFEARGSDFPQGVGRGEKWLKANPFPVKDRVTIKSGTFEASVPAHREALQKLRSELSQGKGKFWMRRADDSPLPVREMGDGVVLEALDERGRAFALHLDEADEARVAGDLAKVGRKLFGQSFRILKVVKRLVEAESGQDLRGAWYGKDGGLGRIIALATEVNGKSVGDAQLRRTLVHEGLHGLREAGAISKVHEAAALRLASKDDGLKRFLDGYDDAQKPQEALAELGARWWSGDAKTRRALTGTIVGKLFRKVEAFFRDAMTMLRGDKRNHPFMETIDDVLRKLDAGEYGNAKAGDDGSPEVLFQRAVDEVPGGKAQAIRDIQYFKDAANGSKENFAAHAFRAIYRSTGERIRAIADDVKIPAAKYLADEFHLKSAGLDDAQAPTFLERVDMKISQLSSKLADAMDSFDKAYSDRASRANASDAFAKLMRNRAAIKKGFNPAHDLAVQAGEVLQRLHDEARSVGLDIGYRRDYYPRQLDRSVLFQNRTRSLNVLAKAIHKSFPEMSVSEVRDAAENWYSRELLGEYGISESGFKHDGTNKPSPMQERILNAASEKIIQDAGLYLNDPAAVMSSYVTRMSRKIELARTMGKIMPNERRNPLWADWIKNGGNPDSPNAKSQALYDAFKRSGNEDALARMIGLMDNVLGRDAIPPSGRIANAAYNSLAWLKTLGMINYLPFTWASAVTEPAINAMTSGKMREAIKPYGNALAKALQHILGLKDPDLQRRAYERVGAFTRRLDSGAAMSRNWQGDDLARLPKRIQEGFMRGTGVQYLTELSELVSAESGSLLMRQLSDELLSGVNKTWVSGQLRRFGIPNKDQAAFAKRVMDAESRGADLLDDPQYALAIRRYVRDTIMAPDATQRPAYANHWAGSLLFSLQNYTWAFTQKVLYPAYRAAMKAVSDGDLTATERLRYLTPIATLPILIGLNGLQYEGRDKLRSIGMDKNAALPPKDDMERAMRAVSGAGVFGRLDPIANWVFNIATGKTGRFGRSIIEAPTGPYASIPAKALTAFESLALNNSKKTNKAERRAAMEAWNLVIGPTIKGGISYAYPNLPFWMKPLAFGGLVGSSLPAVREESFVKPLAGSAAPRQDDKEKSKPRGRYDSDRYRKKKDKP